jgi:hypothetical protein
MKLKVCVIFLLMSFLGISVAAADDIDLLAVRNDATVVGLGLGTLRSISFRLGGTNVLKQVAYMDVNSTTGTKSYDLSTIDYLYFGAPVVDAIATSKVGSGEKMSFTYADGILNIANARGPVRVFSADGRVVGESPQAGAVPVRVKVGQLPKGIYLLHSANQTLKIMIP